MLATAEVIVWHDHILNAIVSGEAGKSLQEVRASGFSETVPQSRPDGYLARSGRKMVILQDLPEKWLSCKILASSFRSSCPLIGSHSCNIFHFEQKFTSESVAYFLRKIINLNRFWIWQYELSEENKLKSAFENC